MIDSKRLARLVLFSGLLFLVSCAHIAPVTEPRRGDSVRRCLEFYSSLDESALQSGTRNASSTPVPGYPYLRSDRFLAAMKDRVRSQGEMEQWVDLMRQMDLAAREKEILNTPDDALTSLEASRGLPPDRRQLVEETVRCSEMLRDHDWSTPGFIKALQLRAKVPDEYSSFLRTVGIFPVASIPVNHVSRRVRGKIGAWFRKPVSDLPSTGELVTFAPEMGERLDPHETQAILASARDNPLGIPLPTPPQSERLAYAFSPVLVQDVSAPYDLPGSIARKRGGLFVDTRKPAVYFYLSHGLHRGRPALQLNYVVWYSQRAGKRAPWIERGRFDGLTIRVSLDHDGSVFMVDIMNNCGCYHLFAPKRDEVLGIRSGGCPLGPFVPQWLPILSQGESFAVRVNSGWHQVERLFGVRDIEKPVPYQILSYDTLETLPFDGGKSRSMFNGRGIVRESARIEPLIFFPMGIPSVGSMRQRGRHAIDLTCRRHFDDPNLFERSFVWKQDIHGLSMLKPPK